MTITHTRFSGLMVLEPQIWGDERGYFFESFSAEKLRSHGISHEWIQDNEAFSQRGVLRGLHYQLPPTAQTKLVRVIYGEVLDVVVDIRPGSVTYGHTFSLILSGTNKKQLLVPRGFAHGYVVLSETALFAYKVDNVYSPTDERGIAFDDSELGIDWILPSSDLLLSEKDRLQPRFGSHALYQE